MKIGLLDGMGLKEEIFERFLKIEFPEIIDNFIMDDGVLDLCHG